MATKHYVEFLYPGALFIETTVREVRSRDARVRVPKDAFAYRFFDRTETVEGKKTLRGRPKNYSGTFYVGGQVMTLADVKRKMPDATTLISKMENEGYEKVIKCRTGNFQPFDDLEDKLVAKK